MTKENKRGVTMTKKGAGEMIIESGTMRGAIAVRPRMTLGSVRELIKAEWDEDMLPPPGNGEFKFEVGGVTYSKSQEQRVMALDCLDLEVPHAKLVVVQNNRNFAQAPSPLLSSETTKATPTPTTHLSSSSSLFSPGTPRHAHPVTVTSSTASLKTPGPTKTKTETDSAATSKRRSLTPRVTRRSSVKDNKNNNTTATKSTATATKTTTRSTRSTATATKTTTTATKTTANATKNIATATRSTANATKNTTTATRSTANATKSTATATKNIATATRSTANATKNTTATPKKKVTNVTKADRGSSQKVSSYQKTSSQKKASTPKTAPTPKKTASTPKTAPTPKAALTVKATSSSKESLTSKTSSTSKRASISPKVLNPMTSSTSKKASNTPKASSSRKDSSPTPLPSSNAKKAPKRSGPSSSSMESSQPRRSRRKSVAVNPAKPNKKPRITSSSSSSEDASGLRLKSFRTEKAFWEAALGRLEGARCSICDQMDPDPDWRYFDNTQTHQNGSGIVRRDADETLQNALSACTKCGIVVHLTCYQSKYKEDDDFNIDVKRHFVCEACRYVEENIGQDDFVPPLCFLCNQKGGALLKAVVRPGKISTWKKKPAHIVERSLYGKTQLWCHSVCGMWNPDSHYQSDSMTFNCSRLVLFDGVALKYHAQPCEVCGRHEGAKLACSENDYCRPCHAADTSTAKQSLTPKKLNLLRGRYHVTCARQAGLDVVVSMGAASRGDNDLSLRCPAHSVGNLESECRELLRMGVNEKRHAGDVPRLHQAVRIVAALGWVKDGCLGQSLRRRDYNGDTFGEALRSFFRQSRFQFIESEVDEVITWLRLAYLSNSPLLGLGNDRIPSEKGDGLPQLPRPVSPSVGLPL